MLLEEQEVPGDQLRWKCREVFQSGTEGAGKVESACLWRFGSGYRVLLLHRLRPGSLRKGFLTRPTAKGRIAFSTAL